jgi:c-di-GMP-binding flagellar brake protein YcgR
VPANRSRTERWRELLEQIASRGGGIEFSIARSDAAGTPPGPDVMWRVRLIGVADDHLAVEHPAAVGHPVHIAAGTPLVAVMAVGQNRWIFHTAVEGTIPGAPGRAPLLRIASPERVERCARRDFLRVSTAELRLASVECYPLLEPASVGAAEAANRATIATMQASPVHLAQAPAPEILPEVGPSFRARLMNIGGGGVGLLVDKNDATAATRHRLLWLRLDLTPTIPAPIAITGKQAHTHIDSEQNLYLGVAFEFAFNPSHRSFVAEQIARYVGMLQARRAAA